MNMKTQNPKPPKSVSSGRIQYDPINDEKTPYSIREFEQIALDCLKDWANEFDGANPFTQEKHTFDEWMAHFKRFMSM